MSRIELLPSLAHYIEQRQAEFDRIPPLRKAELEQLANYALTKLAADGVAQITYLCTHNSRRSHLSQIWGKLAADYYGQPRVQTFSGGTEATALNARVVSSLQRCGFHVTMAPSSCTDNPNYEIRYAANCDPLRCFSKLYHQAPNPTAHFCAVMTCSSADEACPVIPNCDLRLPIRYDDPKVADDTPAEADTYDERCAQIAREMLYFGHRLA